MTETTLPTLPKPPLPTFATLNYFKNQIIKKGGENNNVRVSFSVKSPN